MQYSIKLLSAIILGFCVVAVGCSSTSTSESTGQYLDNTAITAKVKGKLFDALGKDSFNITVKSYKDEVQLSGFVNSQKAKNEATKVAQSVHGVKKVENDLIVKTQVKS